MKRTLVIGLGNDLRGDDAAGLLAARALAASTPPGADVQELGDDLAGLPGAMAGREVVILVDAVLAGTKPGTVMDLPPDAPGLRSRLSSHGLALGEALGLAAALGAAPRVRIIGIAGGCFETGAAASPGVLAAAAAVAARLGEELAACA